MHETSLNSSNANDDYDESAIGLTESRSVNIGADMALAFSEKTSLHLFAQGERIRTESLYNQIKAGDASVVAAVMDNKVIQEFKARKAKLEADYQEGLKTYKAGSEGPEEANELLTRDGRSWRKLG